MNEKEMSKTESGIITLETREEAKLRFLKNAAVKAQEIADATGHPENQFLVAVAFQAWLATP